LLILPYKLLKEKLIFGKAFFIPQLTVNMFSPPSDHIFSFPLKKYLFPLSIDRTFLKQLFKNLVPFL